MEFGFEQVCDQLRTCLRPDSVMEFGLKGSLISIALYYELLVSSTPFTRYNPLSNRLYNQLDKWLHRVNKHPTGCETGCTAGLTTGWMFVYTIQPVVQPVVKPI